MSTVSAGALSDSPGLLVEMHGALWSRRAEVALAEEIWHNACKGAAKKWLHAVSSQVMARLAISVTRP